MNVESAEAIGEVGPYDLTFCFGLLYHTENPFQVVRNLERFTRKVLFVETMVLPTDEPVVHANVVPASGSLGNSSKSLRAAW